MAVDAPHVALLDLGQDPRPPFARDHLADIAEFGCGIAMIELEHNWISRTAFDAWMGGEVDQDLASILRAVCLPLGNCPSEVVRSIREVMRASSGGVARSAVVAEEAASHVGEREARGRFDRAAGVAHQNAAFRPRTQRVLPVVDMSRTVVPSVGDDSCRSERRSA